MDETSLAILLSNCSHLKHKFAGVFAANNFKPLKPNSFQIINESPAYHKGTHWIVMARRGEKIYFADPLGKGIENYPIIFCRCSLMYPNICNFSYPIQPVYTNDCGLYCIYVAHVIFSMYFPKQVYTNPYGLRKFMTHLL